MTPAASSIFEACELHTLPNGMRILCDPVPHVRSVSIGVWILAGSAYESATQAGVSHFLEHLFFKGTTSRTARQLMEAIEGRGGHLNAFTTRDYTCLYIRALDVHTASAIEILADIIKNSQFFDFEKERNVVLEEIATVEDVPEDYAHDLFLLQMWPDHSLGRPIIGSHETVGRFAVEDLRAHYSQWCRPGNVLFTIAGHFDASAVLDQVRSEFGCLGDGPVPPRYTAPEFGRGISTTERDITQSHLCFGFPGVPVADPRRYAYEMLTSALGGGSTSRLFDRIREKEGLAYSVYAFRSGFYLSGHVGVYAAVAPENLSKALALACEEVGKLRDSPIPDKEVLLNQEQIKGGFLMALESTFSRMSHAAKSMIYHDRVIPPEEIVAGIDAVTAEDLHRLAQSIFSADQCAMAILSPTDALRIETVPL